MISHCTSMLMEKKSIMAASAWSPAGCLEQGTPSWVDQRRRAVDTFDQHKARWFQDLDQNKAWWFFEDSAMNYFLKEMNLWFRCWRASALEEQQHHHQELKLAAFRPLHFNQLLSPLGQSSESGLLGPTFKFFRSNVDVHNCRWWWFIFFIMVSQPCILYVVSQPSIL